MRNSAGIIATPGELLSPLVIIAPKRGRHGASPAGVFPFCFGGEAMRRAFGFCQPFAERDGVIPGDINHRFMIIARVAHLTPVELRRLLDPFSVALAAGAFAIPL